MLLFFQFTVIKDHVQSQLQFINFFSDRNMTLWVKKLIGLAKNLKRQSLNTLAFHKSANLYAFPSCRQA